MSHNQISKIIRERIEADIGCDLRDESTDDFVINADKVIYNASHYCDIIINDAVTELVKEWNHARNKQT